MYMREFREALTLLEKIIKYREEYFTNDCLNSEGRKAIERAFMLVLSVDPVLKTRIIKIRRKPCYDNVFKFYEELKTRFYFLNYSNRY